MERRGKPGPASKRGRNRTIIWVAVVLAVVITLLVTEQVALLYLLATVSVTALLIVVAWSDLGGARAPAAEPAPFDDAAAIADGHTPTAGETATARARQRR